MEALPLKMILVLYLLGMSSGGFQASSVHRQREPRSAPFKNRDLDMALNSFDDQYRGCESQMDKKLPDLLSVEQRMNHIYRNAWKNAARKLKEIKKLPEGLRPLHATAVLAYTQQSPLYGDFNRAVQQAGRSRKDYKDKFHYKSLHYLLTRAVEIIHKQKPLTVYRGMTAKISIAKGSKAVRFGQFASSSLVRSRAEYFGTETFFTIQTSQGAFIGNLSFFPGEKEVLIPPFERFKVTRFTKTKTGNNITLASSNVFSKYNCEFLKMKHL